MAYRQTYALAAVNPETGEDDEPWGGDDETLRALRLPKWVPKLTTATTQGPEGTYIHTQDYVLAVKRADQRSNANMAMAGVAGIVIGWLLSRMYR